MHPEYPCAHCIVASTVGTVLKAEIGSRPTPTLSTTSSKAPGVVRRWTRIEDFVQEVADARIYDGVHYRNSTEVGTAMGAQDRRAGGGAVSATARVKDPSGARSGDDGDKLASLPARRWPDMQDVRELLSDSAERAIAYLQSLDERAVAPDPAAVAALDAFDEALPEAGTTIRRGRSRCSTSSARRRRWRWPGRASSASSSAARCR